MASQVITEWLSEYKTLNENEVNTYSSTLQQNEELIKSIYSLLENPLEQEVVDPVCHQLFNFYRTENHELQKFTLDFVPSLIETYLIHVSQNAKRKCGGIEICLLGIYNLEIVDRDGSPAVQSFTIPTLAHSSIYHEPPSLATLALTESVLLRYHSDEPVVITTGPLPQYERLNAQNRFCVLSHVLSIYNRDITNMGSTSRRKLCKMASRISMTGFDMLDRLTCGTLHLNDFKRLASHSSADSGDRERSVKFISEPRITLSQKFLVELLNSVYFSMFNGQSKEGIAALEDLHRRASYELFSEVLLVTNAIRNSLMNNPSGQPGDGPIGVSIALSPTSSNPGFSKMGAITNASFRSKKLPEDIDVVEDDESEGATSPPNYEDVVDNEKTSVEEKMKAVGTKMAKPLKSIMKKAERSHKKKEETEGVPQSASSPSVTSNGDITDPSMISVSVVHNNGRTVVDQIEMKSPSSMNNPPSYYADTHNDDDETNRPLLASNPAYTKDMRVAALNGGNSSGSDEGHYNTAL